MPKSILIACFDFPPNDGIGGRRWAKLAKGMAEQGWQVHVIKADEATSTPTSSWDDDTKNANIFVYSLPRIYPESVSHPKKGLVNKVRYRLAIRKLKRIESGTIYDIAIGWKTHFQQKAIELIEEHNIKAIAATGAPFNLLVYATELKNHFPDIKVLCDYRDPWLTAQNYGMKGLEASRMAAEIQKQEYIFKHADYITCPNDFLLEEIKNTAQQQPKSQFQTLTHFFDRSDLPEDLVGAHGHKDKIRIIYGGAIYMGIEETLDALNLALDQLKVERPDLYQKLDIHFYTPHRQHDRRFVNHECVLFAPPFGKKFFFWLRSSDAAFIFLAEHNKNYLTTKFFEYLPFKKPLLYLGAKGYVARFIEEQNIGIFIEDPVKELAVALDRISATNSNFNQDFDADQFSLDRKALELIKLFE